MKKILFVTTKASVFDGPITRVFDKLGFETHKVDFRGHMFLENGHIVHRVVDKLPMSQRNFLLQKAYSSVDREILKTAKRIKPNFIFVTKAKNTGLDVLDELRKMAPTVNWYTDNMSNWGSLKKVVAHYDYVFNYDLYVVEELKKLGHKNVYHLPWAGEVDKNAQWHDKKDYKYNLVFIGTYHPEVFPREKDLSVLKDLGLHVWGNKFWLETALKDNYHGFIKYDMQKIQQTYSDSKFGLYLESLFELPGSGVTLRPFEITAAGTMMFGQVFRGELPNLFVDGKEFVSFKETSELPEKIKYYLEHESERRAIAKAGFERTRDHHTYHDRIMTILDTMGIKI